MILTELSTPADLSAALPAHPLLLDKVNGFRDVIQKSLLGQAKKLIVIAGPCSIHDVDAALEYAEHIRAANQQFGDQLLIVMRVYLTKPRTTIGWKGLISDPELDGSMNFNLGLHTARQLLIRLAELSVPAATEFLDPILPHYFSELISWCAVGARTAESQLHRELASSLTMPVGFKNNTDGNIQIAMDAVKTAQYPHHYVSMTQAGKPCVIATRGNPLSHIVLRGGHDKTNYAADIIQKTSALLCHENLIPRLMVDCSHGNSLKNANNQLIAANAIIQQISHGEKAIFGIMLESHLVAGKQTLTTKKSLRYGQSITDECIGWPATFVLLEKMAEAVSQNFKGNHHG